MYFIEKTEKIYLALLAAFFISAPLQAANNIVNKSLVSPGSIVVGNTGIIIAGKNIQNNNQKIIYKKYEVPCIIKNIKILASDIDVKIYKQTNNNKKCYIVATQSNDRFLLVGKDSIVINQSDALFFASKVIIYLKKLANISINADSFVDIKAPLDKLSVVSQADGKISLGSVKNLYINLRSDLDLSILNAKKIKTIKLSGTGDLNLYIHAKGVKIDKTDYAGEITINNN